MSTTLAEMNELFADFPKRMCEIKKRKNLTNQQIADGTGIPYNYVARFFSGATTNPQLYNGAALCKFFGVSLDDAFELREKEERNELLEERLKSEKEKLDISLQVNQSQRKTIMFLRCVIFILLAIVLMYVLVFDIGNSEFGLFHRNLLS